ncbi:MAG: TatD family hydrolase [Clostridia bacterium]|nr:TatD family hydrolase [Clostridia bacterium]
MIIDSHAHYAYERYDSEVAYLCERDGKFDVRLAGRETLLKEMRKNGIVGFLEPSIGFDAIEKQLQFVSEHHSFIWSAVGVHPTRCIHTDWDKHEKVREYAENADIIAIGETGLDYHTEEAKQKSDLQKQWFVYHIELADRLRLPLVLHIRMADLDALEILKEYRTKLHGGAVHCFSEDYQTAQEYIDLGFTLGIGAKLLWENDVGEILRDTVRRVPLESLLVETDAPFVLPPLDKALHKVYPDKKISNSSLILPALVKKIADLKGEAYGTVEDTIYRNTIRAFDLPIAEA